MREFKISASESTIGMLQQSIITYQTIIISYLTHCHVGIHIQARLLNNI